MRGRHSVHDNSSTLTRDLCKQLTNRPTHTSQTPSSSIGWLQRQDRSVPHRTSVIGRGIMRSSWYCPHFSVRRHDVTDLEFLVSHQQETFPLTWPLTASAAHVAGVKSRRLIPLLQQPHHDAASYPGETG